MRLVDDVPDAELASLNARYPWRTYVLDARGRRFGRPDGRFHELPSQHVLTCERLLGLAGKAVVELGCHEGTHTLGLAERAASVIAVDARKENVEKARVRTKYFGVRSDVRILDVEREEMPPADLYFHVGVLYHLADPVAHLQKMGSLATDLYLDTHYAEGAQDSYISADGNRYPCRHHTEDVRAPQSGMRTLSRWIPLGLIQRVLAKAFASVVVAATRKERFGPRATVVARNT